MSLQQKFYFLICSVFWGSSYLFIKISLISYQASDIAFFRIALGFIFVFFSFGIPDSVSKKTHFRLFLIAILWFSIPSYFYSKSLETLDSSLVGIINGTTPIIIAVISILFFKEPINKKIFIYLLLGFVGITIINSSIKYENLLGSKGLIYATCAAFGYSISVNLTKPLISKIGSANVLFYTLGYATVINFILFAMNLNLLEVEILPSVSLLLLGLICTGLAYYLYYELLNQIGIVKSTLIVYLIPVFSILLGVLFLKESVSLNETLGISIVLFSSYLIMDEKNLGKK